MPVWSWLTPSPKSRLKLPDPLSSPAPAPPGKPLGALQETAGFPAREDNSLPPAPGFWLFLVQEGGRFVGRGGWLLMASAVSN